MYVWSTNIVYEENEKSIFSHWINTYTSFTDFTTAPQTRELDYFFYILFFFSSDICSFIG